MHKHLENVVHILTDSVFAGGKALRGKTFGHERYLWVNLHQNGDSSG